MPARTKGRAKFDFGGRPFVWWIDGDKYLRIGSIDKRFVISFPLGCAPNEPQSILVVGSEFPGIEASELRPVRLVIPDIPTQAPMGAWLDHILRWSFDPSHLLRRLDGAPRFS